MLKSSPESELVGCGQKCINTIRHLHASPPGWTKTTMYAVAYVYNICSDQTRCLCSLFHSTYSPNSEMFFLGGLKQAVFLSCSKIQYNRLSETVLMFLSRIKERIFVPADPGFPLPHPKTNKKIVSLLCFTHMSVVGGRLVRWC